MSKTVVLDKAELRRLLANKMNKPNITVALQGEPDRDYDLVMVSDATGKVSVKSISEITANSDGGQENILERIKVNGSFVPAKDKIVELSIPNKVSDLDNDIKFLVEADVERFQNSINTINLQFPKIAESIRELDESKVDIGTVSNTFVSKTEHTRDLETLNNTIAFQFQQKKDMADYVKSSDVSTLVGLKFFRATVTMTSDTSHVIDYSSAGFTEAPTISITAHSNDPSSTAAETGNYATIVSKTNTQCVIRNNGAISVGLVGTVNTSRTATVDIIAIGK